MATGFTFGAKTTAAAPSFGTGSITFGTPAPATQSQPQFGFGSTAASTPSLFATPAAPAFGVKPTTTASAGFTAATPSSGFTFGTPASTAPSTGFAFATPASSAPSTGLSSTTGLSFGTPASSASLGFKPPATSGGLTFGATTSAPSLGLNFSGISSAAPTLNFGAPTTISTASGLGGLAPSTSGIATTTQSVGLGGIATTQSKTGVSASQKETPPKEQPLPNEFVQLVNQFKNLVQEEKSRSSEVARCSVNEYHKVEAELDSLNQQISQMDNQVMSNRYEVEQLKYEAAKGLQSMEMAQRTQDTPPSLQYDNNAPLQFFLDLADKFERELQMLKVKIDNTEKFVRKCNEPSLLTSQDLAMGLKRLHETFVALAGRMQSVHSQVETQKEAFLTLRRQVMKDNSNPFEKVMKNTEAINAIMKNATKNVPPNLAAGPTPFNSVALGSNNLTLASQQTPPPPYPATTAALSLGTSTSLFGTPTTTASLFQPSSFGTSFQMNNSTNFQLQKPPTGSKRGKQ